MDPLVPLRRTLVALAVGSVVVATYLESREIIEWSQIRWFVHLSLVGGLLWFCHHIKYDKGWIGRGPKDLMAEAKQIDGRIREGKDPFKPWLSISAVSKRKGLAKLKQIQERIERFPWRFDEHDVQVRQIDRWVHDNE